MALVAVVQQLRVELDRDVQSAPDCSSRTDLTFTPSASQAPTASRSRPPRVRFTPQCRPMSGRLSACVLFDVTSYACLPTSRAATPNSTTISTVSGQELTSSCPRCPKWKSQKVD